MHRENQIKQFPIVTTHWWPKTRNEQFVWENEQYLYRFLPLVHNHVQVIWVRTHIRCVTCVWVRSGSRLTWARACIVFVYEPERALYLYTSSPLYSYTSQSVHCICIRALHVSVSFICNSASTLDGGRVWSVVLTQLRGIFLLEDAHCHRSCRFWTV